MLVEFYGLSVRTPLDPVLPLTSLMYRLPGHLLFVIQDTFAGLQCGSLIFVVVIRMFRLYWCYATLGSASCYNIGCFDFVYMKLFVVRSCYLCVMFMCQTRECRPNEGAPRFFEEMYDAFTKMNGRCV